MQLEKYLTPPLDSKKHSTQVEDYVTQKSGTGSLVIRLCDQSPVWTGIKAWCGECGCEILKNKQFQGYVPQ